MSVPMVTCEICHQEVTKRSTLSLESLDLGGVIGLGRACRSHEQVTQALAAKIEQEKLRGLITLASAGLRIMSGAASVRVLHTFFKWPEELIYFRLSARMAKKEVEQIREEVKKMGGPLMSSQEMINSVNVAASLMDKYTPSVAVGLSLLSK